MTTTISYLKRTSFIALLVVSVGVMAHITRADASTSETESLAIAAPDVQLDQLDLPEQDGAYRLTGYQWSSNAVSYRFANCPSSIDCATAQEAVRTAFAQWSAVCNISFIEVEDSALTEISWQRGDFGLDIAFDGPGGYLAIGRPPYYDGAHPWDGDLFFDDEEAWGLTASPQAGVYHLRTTALHEIGHTIGLHHSYDPWSVMWHQDNGVDQLTYTDIAGCQAMYGAP